VATRLQRRRSAGRRSIHKLLLDAIRSPARAEFATDPVAGSRTPSGTPSVSPRLAVAEAVLAFPPAALGDAVRLIMIDLDATDDPTTASRNSPSSTVLDTWCYLPLIATVTFNTSRCSSWWAPCCAGTGAATRESRPAAPAVRPLQARFPAPAARAGRCRFAEAKLLTFLDRAEIEYVLGSEQRAAGQARPPSAGPGRMRARTTRGDRHAVRRDALRGAALGPQAAHHHEGRGPVLSGRSRKDNPRFLVTNLPHRPARSTPGSMRRGDMENRIKELQAGCHGSDQLLALRANQLRLLLSVAACVLFQVLQLCARPRRSARADLDPARALLKVAVWVERSVRRIVLHLPQTFRGARRGSIWRTRSAPSEAHGAHAPASPGPPCL